MKVSILKNLSKAFMLASTSMLISCSADGSSKANSQYVSASAMAEDSIKEFKTANYKKSFELASSADKKVRKILEDYPESEIALKIVTDENLRLGFCKYSDFRERILPEIEKIADPNMSAFDLVWASVVANPENVSQAALEFGTYLAFYENQMNALQSVGAKNPKRISKKDIDNMLLACLDIIKDPQAKLSLSKNIQMSKSVKGGDLPSFDSNAKKQTVASANFVDAKKFLEQANRDAIMAVYNVEASARLLKASKDISKADPSFENFQKILILAFENVKKISSKKLKNEALLNIVTALSNSLLNDEALLGVELIQGDDVLKSKCLENISTSYADSKKFKKALEVAKMLPSDEQRIARLCHVAAALANVGNFKDAIDVANSISNKIMSTSCLLEVAAIQWKSNPKEAAKILDKLDIEYLNASNFAGFCLKLGIQPSLQKDNLTSSYENVLSIIEKLVDYDKSLAKTWAESLAKRIMEKSDPSTLAQIASRVCFVMLNTSADTKHIQDFAYDAMLRANPQIMGRLFADLGAYASLKGLNDDAEGFFKKSAAICKSPNGKSNKMYLLWQICASNFDKQRAVSFVGDFLPIITK